MAWTRLLPFRIAKRIDTLARQVAEQSHDTVLKRVAGQTTEMSFSEARGYIRAVGGQTVRRQARIVQVGSEPLPAWAATRVVNTATQRVVHAVIRDLVASNAPQLRYRAAG